MGAQDHKDIRAGSDQIVPDVLCTTVHTYVIAAGVDIGMNGHNGLPISIRRENRLCPSDRGRARRVLQVYNHIIITAGGEQLVTVVVPILWEIPAIPDLSLIAITGEGPVVIRAIRWIVRIGPGYGSQLVMITGQESVGNHSIQQAHAVVHAGPLTRVVPVIDDVAPVCHKNDIFGHDVIDNPLRLSREYLLISPVQNVILSIR